jgi:chemotaxis protein MotA
MFAIIGMLVVLAAVIGGFLMEHGPIRVLMQPSELLIIGGAAIGTLLVANPLHTLKGVVSGLMLVMTGSKFNKQRYLDALKMMYDLFGKIRHDGPAAVESDIEAPMESKFFANYPNFLKDQETREFVCDTMRMAIMGGVEPFDVDQMIEADMDVHAH